MKTENLAEPDDMKIYVEMCPFCGLVDVILIRTMGASYLECSCGAIGPSGNDWKAAVLKWNHRESVGLVRQTGQVIILKTGEEGL